MPDKTPAPIATAEDVRVLARLCEGSRIMASYKSYLALADALDALAKAERGCGENQPWPDDVDVYICGQHEYRCGSCYDAREAAITRLTGGEA